MAKKAKAKAAKKATKAKPAAKKSAAKKPAAAKSKAKPAAAASTPAAAPAPKPLKPLTMKQRLALIRVDPTTGRCPHNLVPETCSFCMSI